MHCQLSATKQDLDKIQSGTEVDAGLLDVVAVIRTAFRMCMRHVAAVLSTKARLPAMHNATTFPFANYKVLPMPPSLVMQQSTS